MGGDQWHHNDGTKMWVNSGRTVWPWTEDLCLKCTARYPIWSTLGYCYQFAFCDQIQVFLEYVTRSRTNGVYAVNNNHLSLPLWWYEFIPIFRALAMECIGWDCNPYAFILVMSFQAWQKLVVCRISFFRCARRDEPSSSLESFHISFEIFILSNIRIFERIKQWLVWTVIYLKSSSESTWKCWREWHMKEYKSFDASPRYYGPILACPFLTLISSRFLYAGMNLIWLSGLQ